MPAPLRRLPHVPGCSRSRSRSSSAATGRRTRDRYGRLLAYVWIPGGRDLGYQLVAGGFAKVYVYHDPFQRLPAYRTAESRAKSAAVGTWKACGSTTIRPVAPAPPPAAKLSPELLAVPADRQRPRLRRRPGARRRSRSRRRLRPVPPRRRQRRLRLRVGADDHDRRFVDGDPSGGLCSPGGDAANSPRR